MSITDYEIWRGEGRPECRDCGNAVRAGQKHKCWKTGKTRVVRELTENDGRGAKL